MATTPTAPALGTAREGYGTIDVTTCSTVTAITTVTSLVANNRYLYNGSSWEQRYNDLEVTVLASAARTASVNSDDQTNYGARGVRLTLDVTARQLPATITVKVQAKDSVSGQYLDMTDCAFATANSISTDELIIYPGLTAAANVVVSDVLPRTWRAVATYGGSNAITFSLAAAYIL